MARADIVDLGRRAKAASRALAVAAGAAKDGALRLAADLIEQFTNALDQRVQPGDALVGRAVFEEGREAIEVEFDAPPEQDNIGVRRNRARRMVGI